MSAGKVVKGGLAVIGGLTLLGALAGSVVLRAIVTQGFSARDNPSATETLMARTLRSWSAPSNAANMTNPLRPTPEVLSQARAHWADHCASCHANDGSGATDIGRGLYPKAPDMRLPQTQRLSDGELYFIIENGIRLTGMPAWGQGGEKDEETWALVAFIRHLPALPPAELEEMKAMNPRSPMEQREDQDEADFLGSGAGAGTDAGLPAPHLHH